MLNWSNMPEHLQLGDVNLASLNTGEVMALFNEAKKCNVLDEFADLFWSQYGRFPHKAVCLQDVCNLLEEFKRTVGRQYDNAVNHKYGLLSKSFTKMFAERYNDIEDAIFWLVYEKKCVRSCKPYKIKLKLDKNNGKTDN